jgi:nucleoside-diphosphate-sugar epimerase
VNLDGSLTVLAAACEARARRFIFASTCSNYGRSPDPGTYLDETSPLRPVSLYAETKVAIERMLLDPAASWAKLCPTVLRLATVFGVSPRMRFDLTVNEFTAEMLSRGHLVVYGEQFWRPYVHVRDVARAVVQVLSTPDTVVDRQVFNVGATEENYQKQQLVGFIRRHAPEATVEYVPRQEDPRDYRVSFERARTGLRFHTTRTVPDGIAEVAALLRSGAVRDWTDPRYRN